MYFHFLPLKKDYSYPFTIMDVCIYNYGCNISNVIRQVQYALYAIKTMRIVQLNVVVKGCSFLMNVGWQH